MKEKMDTKTINYVLLPYKTMKDKEKGELKYFPAKKGVAKKENATEFLTKIGNVSSSEEISIKGARDCIVLGSFKDNTRTNECFISTSMLKIDDDKDTSENVSCYEKLATSQLEFAWHTTYSYNCNNYRRRIFVPLTKEVNKQDYEKVYSVFIKQFHFHLDDNCGIKVAQCMYLPSHQKGVEPLGEYHQGEAYDVEKALHYYDEKMKHGQENELSDNDLGKCFNTTSFSGAFNSYYKDNPQLVNFYLKNFYSNVEFIDSDHEVARWKKIDSNSTAGLALYKNGTYYCFHKNDDVADKPLTPFKLVMYKRFNKNYDATVDFIMKNDESFISSKTYKDYLGEDEFCDDFFSLSSYAGVKLPQKKFLLENIFPYGNRCLVYGEKSSGKSSFMSDLCICICNGDENYGSIRIDAKYHRTLYIGMEEEKEDLVRRLQKQCEGRGYDLKCLENCHFITRRNFFWECDNKFTEKFKRVLMRNKYDLVVIEPFRSLPEEENSNSKVQAVLNTLQTITNDFEATMVIIAHPGKDVTKSTRGASALEDDVRSVVKFCSKNMNEKTINLEKGSFIYDPNLKMLPAYEVYENDYQNFEIGERIIIPSKKEKEDKNQEIFQEYQDFVKEGKLTKTSIYDALSKKYDKTSDAIKKSIQRLEKV